MQACNCKKKVEFKDVERLEKSSIRDQREVCHFTRRSSYDMVKNYEEMKGVVL